MSIDTSGRRTHRHIIRSAAIISFATFCSRLLGFLRDIVLARLFGVYLYAQAFAVAFKIPNLFRDMLGEGAANAAIVPVFSEYAVKRSKEEFWELANVVLNLLLVILAGVVILGVIFSGLIVRLIAPGFIASPEKLAFTIRLNQIIFPYILLVSLAAFSMGLLNSLKHFAVPAFAPCLLNISLIVFVLLFGEGITGLSIGILLGGILQLAVQLPVLWRKGFRLRHFLSRFRHPEAKTIGKLMLPRMFGTCVYQLNNFIDSIFGSFASIVGEGGVAVLYFSYHLIMFPLGIFSTALSQAILPTFSRQALEDNRGNLTLTLSWSLRMLFLVMLPASAGFMALARPIVSVLFGAGKFDIYAVNSTASALFFYSIGLCAYGATRIIYTCFFSLKDTATPAKIAVLTLALNIILNSLLMFPLKISGLALATSASGIATSFTAFTILRKRLTGFKAEVIFYSFLRIFCASICMGAVCYLTFQKTAAWDKLLQLGFSICAGILSYVIFCFLFRVPEMGELWQRLLKKK